MEDLLPGPVADALELLAGESPTSRTFIGGLVVGALVGSVIAGAGFLRRRGAASGRQAPKG
ncbi:MAG TPA: hypothetical protein VF770_05895 [Solirubrobacterales bacterium]